MTPKEKALERIRKLLALAEDKGAYEGEIENALKAAQKLMSQYDIEHGEIDLSPEDIAMIYEEFHPNKQERKYWLWDLLMVIGNSFSVTVNKGWKYKNETERTGGLVETFKLYGTKNDVKLVQEIFSKTFPIIRNLANKRYREHCNKKLQEQMLFGMPLVTPAKSKFFNDYVDGFLNGLNSKLEAQKKQSKEEDTTGKYGLILVKKDDLIKAFIKENTKKITDQKSRKERNIDYQTYMQGLQDGETQHDKQIE